ncbi:Uncharacterised protein [Pseudomonas aeruginosa]|nr:Uncharacterised protein [Pseudomonas aeruginosa]
MGMCGWMNMSRASMNDSMRPLPWVNGPKPSPNSYERVVLPEVRLWIAQLGIEVVDEGGWDFPSFAGRQAVAGANEDSGRPEPASSEEGCS